MTIVPSFNAAAQRTNTSQINRKSAAMALNHSSLSKQDCMNDKLQTSQILIKNNDQYGVHNDQNDFT